jgi:subtilisin family serine protease
VSGRLKVSVFFVFILSTVFLGSSLCAQERNQKTELLVYILPGSFELPEEEKGFVPLMQLGSSIRSEELKTAFLNSNVKSIGKAFPNWANRDSIVVRSNGETVELPPFQRIFILNFEDEAGVNIAINILNKLPEVVFAEKHVEIEFHNDPLYIDGSQWYLNNNGSNGGISGADINIEEAWSIFKGSPNTIIAIIDEGVDLQHEEFQGRISGDNPLKARHGTLVAGVAAASAMNDTGIRGVNWHAQILSKKVTNFDKTVNKEVPLPDDQVAQKIIDAVSAGADVLNCSWGAKHSSTIKMAFEHAYNMDRVTVAAMGNEGTALTNYPAVTEML